MDVKALLDMLPFNGFKMVLGAIAAILFGIGGAALGKLDSTAAAGFILGGWTALAQAHKDLKNNATVPVVLPPQP